MTPFRRAAALVATLLLAAACTRVEAPGEKGGDASSSPSSASSSSSEDKGGAAATFTDPAVPIRVAAGTEFVIVVEANGTTGYQWALADSLPAGVVTHLSNDYQTDEAPKGNEPVAGAGGRERWRFRAVGAGQASIPLVLRRSWESGAPVDSARFQVVVQ
jgi:predicted secreted protein